MTGPEAGGKLWARERFEDDGRGVSTETSESVAGWPHSALSGRRSVWLAAVAAATVAGGALRFVHLGSQSMWEDEVITMTLLREHLWTMLRYGLPYQENTPPLYYLIGWVWVRLFGTSAGDLRSLSALAGTATVPVAFLAARRLVGPLAGLVAALLVAFSPMLVWYSQEARVYSLFALLSALSFLFFVRTLAIAGRRDLWMWVLFSALALLTHYFAVFLIIVEGGWLIYRRGMSPGLGLAFAPLALLGLALLPLIEKQRSTGTADFIADTKVTIRLEQLGGWFTTGDYRAAPALLAAGLLSPIGIALLVHGGLRPGRRGGLAALSVGLGTIAIPLLLLVVGLDYFFFRNLILAWLPLAIGLAAGFASSRWGLAAGAALCVVFLIADVAVFREPNLQRDDWRAVAAAVTASGKPAAIDVYPAWDTEALNYYAPALVQEGARPLRVRSLWFIGVSSQFSGWKAPAALRFDVPSGFRLVSTRALQHFVISEYRGPRPEVANEAELGRLIDGANGKTIPHAAALLSG